MLNSKGERELAYVATITDMKRIEGYDKICTYYVNGWTCIAGINDFKIGDKCVFIEPDSLCPYTDIFNFLNEGIDEFTGNKRADRHKIKVQKFCKGKAISAGLIMTLNQCKLKEDIAIGEFLTEKLGITYWEKEDNQRKADYSKYTSMQARHKKFFKTKLGKWLMKREWGRKICFFFMGKKKDKKTDWPSWVIKTDEERCQNNFNQMKALNKKWIRTEKIDGTSTTFTMKQAKPKKREMLVCSRNIVFNTPEKELRNFYKDSDGNVYLEMAAKYDMNMVLNYILNKHPEYEYITIQGETYGGSIQKRNYGKEHKLVIFNYIYKENGKAPVRLNPIEMVDVIQKINKDLWEESERSIDRYLACVPVLDTLDNPFELPKTCDDLLALAGGESIIDGGMREGIVLRALDGESSFKAVDNEFIVKYHAN